MLLIRLANLGCAAISLILLLPGLLMTLALFVVLGAAGLLPGVLDDAYDAGAAQVARWYLTSGTYEGARIESIAVEPLAAAADGSPRAEVRVAVGLDGRGDLSDVARTVLRRVGDLLSGPIPLADGVATVRVSLRDRAGRLAVRVDRALLDDWRAGRRSDAWLAARW